MTDNVENILKNLNERLQERYIQIKQNNLNYYTYGNL